MTNTQSTPPNPLIQNHQAWCWAVCAKIVGAEYKTRHQEFDFNLSNLETQFPYGVPVDYDNLGGFRLHTLGIHEGCPTVDLWQWVISRALSPEGIALASDVTKERAVRFVITGDPDSPLVAVNTFGRFGANSNVGDFLHELFAEPSAIGECIIGNCHIVSKMSFHSVVIKNTRGTLTVYDPWDGLSQRVTAEQLFSMGFSTGLGLGVVKWIQYID